MHILQLQWLDESGSHGGGLYVNSEHVVSVRFIRNNKPVSDGRVVISMVNGKEYTIAGTMSNFLEEWQGIA